MHERGQRSKLASRGGAAYTHTHKEGWPRPIPTIRAPRARPLRCTGRRLPVCRRAAVRPLATACRPDSEAPPPPTCALAPPFPPLVTACTGAGYAWGSQPSAAAFQSLTAYTVLVSWGLAHEAVATHTTGTHTTGTIQSFESFYRARAGVHTAASAVGTGQRAARRHASGAKCEYAGLLYRCGKAS